MRVCALDDIVPGTGVCALVGGEQIAVFRIDQETYAIGNRDPFSGANVLSRGIVGDLLTLFGQIENRLGVGRKFPSLQGFCVI